MSKVAKSTLTLMIATIIAKILGFGRELVLASGYGASMYSDAYIVAMNIPLVIVTIIGGLIVTVFIPIYFEINKELDNDNAIKFMNNVVNIIIILCLLLGIIGFVFTEPIVKLFAMGFEGQTLNIAISFTRITILTIVLTGLSYVMTSFLQANNNFVVPGFITVPKNIIIIISIVASLKYGLMVLIWGSFLGIAMEFIIQIPFVIKYGYRYKLYINIKDKYIRKAAYLAVPVLLGVAVNQVNTMIDRTLASTLVEGSISALNYANRLNEFVTALFITSLSAVIYPSLAKLSLGENKDKFIGTVVQSINSVILLVMPISVGAIVLASPIVKLLFERGEFDSRATSMTVIALTMYSLGMLAFGLREILTKVFYSLQDTKTPMRNAAIAIGINIILNIIFVKYLKIAGLALATSISALICTVLLFISLKRKIGYFGQNRIIITLIKSLISSIIMGVITYFSYTFIINSLSSGIISDIISLFVSITLGAIVYGLLLLIFKIDELIVIKDVITSRIKKINKNTATI